MRLFMAASLTLLGRGRRGLALTAGPRELRIASQLTEVFAPTHLDVLNESHGRHEDESHFKVVVVSDKFDGVSQLIKRHRMVMGALTDNEGKLDFHALSIAVAKTPFEWDGTVAPSPKCVGGDGRGMAR
ncbi:bola protein [Pelagophyceae sp. CCMP2097]|nr:bola protein [Pelagophyceae sp. CCMP2097]|mmetsp:Transcript_21887/g.74222  ORF Transcript_21887/g.74222 Transcript_21887/m.74222 type:complete len:129 (-) Transcript_21887:52-438(-)